MRHRLLPWIAAFLFAAPATAQEWATLGLLRVRDMTPFGLTRLDFLPAHAVKAAPGTFAVEANLSYQNTWALSDNVKEYLSERGTRRGELTAQDLESILDLPGDAYLVDGELGLVDVTFHLQTASRFGLYLTVPYYSFDSRFLDSTIESFHGAIGVSNAGREFVPLDRFLVVADLQDTRVVLDGVPASDFGDPVFGLRYTLNAVTGKRNIVVEAAAKLAVRGEQSLVSSGENDYGLQVSFQRFYRRNALYASLAGVLFASPNEGLANDLVIPTLILGWETKLSRRFNFVLQGYASKSTVQETELDELSATKIQASMGVGWFYRGYALRLGVTENIANFNNTPDVGVTFSVAKVFQGSGAPLD